MDDFSIELKQIDTRYESFRLANKKREQLLLDSISSSGILCPLEGFKQGEVFVLLNGHKRLRAAKKLKINIFPFREMASTEVAAIFALLNAATTQSLHLFEEMKLVDELYSIHGNINARHCKIPRKEHILGKYQDRIVK